MPIIATGWCHPSLPGCPGGSCDRGASAPVVRSQSQPPKGGTLLVQPYSCVCTASVRPLYHLHSCTRDSDNIDNIQALHIPLLLPPSAPFQGLPIRCTTYIFHDRVRQTQLCQMMNLLWYSNSFI